MQWNNGCVGVICGILLLVKGGEECGIVTGEGVRNFFWGGRDDWTIVVWGTMGIVNAD